jgi:outer membrane immunogenic protein
LVAGAEADFDLASLDGQRQAIFTSLRNPNDTDAIMAEQRVDWLGSLRARLGVPWGHTLLYATGGIAFEGLSTSTLLSANTGVAVFGDSATGNFTRVRTGYALGAGDEWMIAPNWTLRGEFLYYGFSGKSVDATAIAHNCQTAGTCGVNVGAGANDVEALRLGLNYKW